VPGGPSSAAEAATAPAPPTTPDATAAPGVPVTAAPSRTAAQRSAPATAGARAAASAERRLAEVAAVGVMAIWAGNFIVVKSTIPILTPIGYTFLRFLVAGLVLLAICLWREGSVRIPRRDLVPIALLGGIGFGAYQLLWPTALSTTTVGNSALLIASTPIFTALISAAIGADRLGPAKALGAGVAFVGVALVAASHGFSLDGGTLGDVLTIAAAICWAAYVSFGAGVLRHHSPLRTTTWAILSGTVVLAPVGLWQLSGADLSVVGPAQVGAVLYSGLLAGALGNVVVFWAIRLLGPTRITNLQFLPPALAIVMAAVFLGEAILPTQLIGGAVIVLGVVVARRDRLALRGRVSSAA